MIDPGLNDNFDTGSKNGIGTTAVQLTATSYVPRNGVMIKAANDNGGNVYVGPNSSVTKGDNADNDGMELGPGESVVVAVDNVNKIYLIASTANQKVFWMAV